MKPIQTVKKSTDFLTYCWKDLIKPSLVSFSEDQYNIVGVNYLHRVLLRQCNLAFMQIKHLLPKDPTITAALPARIHGWASQLYHSLSCNRKLPNCRPLQMYMQTDSQIYPRPGCSGEPRGHMVLFLSPILISQEGMEKTRVMVSVS